MRGSTDSRGRRKKMIEVKSFAALRRFSPDKLQKLNLFETDRFFCDVYCLEPGQEQKAHAHAGSDKLYAVLEGSVEVRVGSETRELRAGAVALCPAGSEVKGPKVAGSEAILTREALALVERLHRELNARREQLLARRAERQRELDRGQEFQFLPETKKVREGDWKVAGIPKDLARRFVEITGPVERKMMINALNSGADVFMADFEDALSPTWSNIVVGHQNLKDAVRRTLSFSSPEGKQYKLNQKIATLLVRPRGWHLPEKHVLVDGQPVSGSLIDFALTLFHNAREQLDRGTGTYFYLPKLESHLEARLWNDAFVLAQDSLKITRGAIRATVLVETLPAAFEMDEILYELRDHMSGLNAGRWDYMFSLIKKYRTRKDKVLPDRVQVAMTVPFMRAYTELP